MATPKTVNNSATGHHTHTVSIGEATERGPWCNQPVTRAEYNRIRKQIEATERARVAKVEESLKAQFGREQQQAAAKAKAEIDKAKRDAAAQVEKAKREAASREASIRQQANKAATAALAPKIVEAVNAEKQRSYSEKLKLTEQLEDMKRRLEKKTAGELGDEAEVDLFEALKREFAGDEIVRVPKGVNAGENMHRRAGVKLHHGWMPNAPTGGLLLRDKQDEKRIASPANVPRRRALPHQACSRCLN